MREPTRTVTFRLPKSSATAVDRIAQDEEIPKTRVVHRAIQTEKFFKRAEQRMARVYYETPDGEQVELERHM